MDRKSLGARIKAQRIKCGLSQEEFAEKLHCTSSHIGKVENGKVGVSIELLVSIANELQTTVDQLLQDSYDYKEQVIIRDIYKAHWKPSDKDKNHRMRNAAVSDRHHRKGA